MPSTYHVLQSSLVLLILTVRESAPDGLVFRSGCCPRSDVPDIAKKTRDFIEQYGYDAEIHEVTTEDGYLIKLHRVVPQTSDEFNTGLRPPVIVQHGIAAASSLWLLSREKSLPFVLARAGFDVWMVDTRENSYTRQHIYLPTTDPRFWRFSFHEQGVFDLAAATDYVLKETMQEKLFYIGHSRGTTMAFALLSSRPEYNSKFHLLSLYAPIAFISHAQNPVLQFLFKHNVASNVKTLVKTLGAYILPGSSESAIQFRGIVCNRTQITCMNLIYSFGGFDYELLDKPMIPVYLSHYPEAGAVQEYLHYIQIGSTDQFRQFDYGMKKNLEFYGSPHPPEYDLSRITAPLALYYGYNDFLTRPKDLNRLINSLNSIAATIQVPFKKFTHSDFMWGTKADEYVYQTTIDLMRQYVP